MTESTNPKGHSVTCWIEAEPYEQLTQMAKGDDRPVSNMAKKLLLEGLAARTAPKRLRQKRDILTAAEAADQHLPAAGA